MSAVSAVASSVAAELVDGVVRVRLEDGRTADFHPLALRDGCLCASCRHPMSGQRLFESSAVVPHARVAAVTSEDGTLVVDWEGGHRSSFGGEWLSAEADALAEMTRPRRKVTHWGAELTGRRPSEPYGGVIADRAVFGRWLAAISEYGFAVLTGAPVRANTVSAVAELFGHVRTTNYGRVFDVTVRVDATNLADTSMPLSLHTDNPYRQPVPTLQLLHCLASSANGGDTVLVDGFRAVTLLAEESPAKLAVLLTQPIRFAYRDANADLSADTPVVVLDSSGEPVALNVNNRSKGVPIGTPAAVARWYEAYFELLSLFEQPDAQVVFRLAPGDVIVFDNLRVLHARTGFSGEGARRLQGCYADVDGLLSTLAVLERKWKA